MTELRYLAPDTLDEAIGAFAKAGSAARILAGGTDLLVQMRSGALKPGVIVDIKKIPEMTQIEQTGLSMDQIKNIGGGLLSYIKDADPALAKQIGDAVPALRDHLA